jgi:hypothetical protein
MRSSIRQICIPFCKLSLDFNSAVYRIHDTAELCQDVVPRSINYAASELLNKIGYYCAVGCECANGCLFIVVHESAVTFNVCTENGGELTLKTFICHRITPDIKVSNKGTQYVDQSEKCSVRRAARFDSANREPLQVRSIRAINIFTQFIGI